MAIAYNSTSIANEVAGGSTTLTWSHTCNVADKKLIVAVGGRASISGITYNGVAMTNITNQYDTYQHCSYYYLDAPATGSAYSITVTYSSSATYRQGLAVGLSGASSGLGAIGTSETNFVLSVPKTVTSSITTTAANSHIFTIPTLNDYAATYCSFGASQTEILRNTAPNWGFFLQYKVKALAGADTTTLTNSGSVNNIMITSFELKEEISNQANFFAFF